VENKFFLNKNRLIVWGDFLLLFFVSPCGILSMRFHAKEGVMTDKNLGKDSVTELVFAMGNQNGERKFFGVPLSEEDLRVTTMELPSMDANLFVSMEKRVAQTGVFVDDAYCPRKDGRRPTERIPDEVREKLLADLNRLTD